MILNYKKRSLVAFMAGALLAAIITSLEVNTVVVAQETSLLRHASYENTIGNENAENQKSVGRKTKQAIERKPTTLTQFVGDYVTYHEREHHTRELTDPCTSCAAAATSTVFDRKVQKKENVTSNQSDGALECAANAIQRIFLIIAGFIVSPFLLGFFLIVGCTTLNCTDVFLVSLLFYITFPIWLPSAILWYITTCGSDFPFNPFGEFLDRRVLSSSSKDNFELPFHEVKKIMNNLLLSESYLDENANRRLESAERAMLHSNSESFDFKTMMAREIKSSMQAIADHFNTLDISDSDNGTLNIVIPNLVISIP